jgi:predicted nucleic acid-binding protein
MSDNIFIDTNIIVYTRIQKEEAKYEVARAFFEEHAKDKIYISTQVLSETYVALRKNKINELDVRKLIDDCILKMNVLSVTVDTIELCFKLKERYGYSYWDSLILSAAFLGNCSVVYSEDMQHGQIIENKMKIINPFK